MNQRVYLWFKVAVGFQFLTAVIHSLSFFSTPTPANATEKILFELMQYYERDLAGRLVTTESLMTALSVCFTLLCLFAALVNAYLLRYSKEPNILRGILLINTLRNAK